MRRLGTRGGVVREGTESAAVGDEDAFRIVAAHFLGFLEALLVSSFCAAAGRSRFPPQMSIIQVGQWLAPDFRGTLSNMVC